MVTSYLIPISISCILSVSLICIKQRRFRNKVTSPPSQPKSSNQVGSEDLEAGSFKSSLQIDIPESSGKMTTIVQTSDNQNSDENKGDELMMQEFKIGDENLDAIQVLEQEVMTNEQSNVEVDLKTSKFQENESLKDFFDDKNSYLDILVFSKNEEKCIAQIQSAKRSLITNLLLCGLLIIGHVVITLLPKAESIFYSIIMFTSIKGALPILSTVANFGTVQFIISQYKSYFC